MASELFTTPGVLSRTLPDEVLSLICSELGTDRDYATLYNCARSCKSLADPALRTLYRYHNDAPAFKNEDVEMTAITKRNTFQSKVAATERALRRQSNIWRSIILSTQDQTFKPYCVYMRTLDFRNLSNMLEDYSFRGKVREDFFAGSLAQFRFDQTEDQKPTKQFQYLDVLPTINAVGDAITTKSAYLEELDGHLNQHHLPQWIRHSPYLRNMVLYLGNALTEEAGSALQESAQQFSSLTVREWSDPNADEMFAGFLKGLNSHTLEYFEMISINRLGELSFDSLATHASSLRQLKLSNLTEDAVKSLNKLRPCTSIQVLSLEDNTRGQVHLETDHEDVFVEVVAWLSACRELRDISFKNFFDGPAILARVLSSQTVRLHRLSLEGYELRLDSAAAFHTALSDQQQLEIVELKGSCEDANQNHFAILVAALCNMNGLRELRLKDISDDFEEQHITNLAFGLPLLEDFWTSGQNVGADVLPVLATLKHLKTLNFYALTQFNCADIVDFISQLDAKTQSGFSLNLMAQDLEFNLTDDEQDLIRDILRASVDGRFDFVVWRDEEWENSDDD